MLPRGHEELGRALQVGDQGLEDWSQLIGGAADPIGDRGTVSVPSPRSHCLAGSSPPDTRFRITM